MIVRLGESREVFQLRLNGSSEVVKAGDRNNRDLMFLVEKSPDGVVLRFRLSGSITESAVNVFGAILAEISASNARELILNLSGLNFMNSIGIQGWMGFLKRIDPARKVVFEECSPEVVAHINLILGFAKRAEIRSFLAPYSCAKCRKQSNVLYRSQEVSVDDYPKPPNCECGHEMTLEEPEDEYFRFLER